MVGNRRGNEPVARSVSFRVRSLPSEHFEDSGTDSMPRSPGDASGRGVRRRWRHARTGPYPKQGARSRQGRNGRKGICSELPAALIDGSS